MMAVKELGARLELDERLRDDLGVKESVQSDNVLRWDGERLYVEQDIFHNGQLVHRKYRRTVTDQVVQLLAGMGRS